MSTDGYIAPSTTCRTKQVELCTGKPSPESVLLIQRRVTAILLACTEYQWGLRQQSYNFHRPSSKCNHLRNNMCRSNSTCLRMS